MIVSRAPLRFSLGGGGTDLYDYASRQGGYVVAGAIDKYVYLTVNRRFYRDLRLAYSKTEIVADIEAVEHPIFREALDMLDLRHSLELTSVAELPANSGLGSSSTFTVALLNALHTYKREFVPSQQLAEEACHIEIDRLGEPVGKQDQYIAAFGSVIAMTFNVDGSVEVERVPVRDEVLDELESNLVVVHSGVEREARVVLQEQGRSLREPDGKASSELDRIKELGHEVYDLLVSGEVDRYGELLHEHWTRKRRITSAMSDRTLDDHYTAARDAGAIGGKIMGAGGGGFFMFYVRPENRRRLIGTMRERGLRQMRFRFHSEGARIVANL